MFYFAKQPSLSKETNLYKKFQHFPFHLVDPSPWPILTSFSLLNLTIGAVLYMHGYKNGGIVLTIGFVLEIGSGAIKITTSGSN